MNTYTRKKYFAIIVLTLIISLVFTMITPMQADASTYNKKCITLTPALNEAALNYVKEIYTDKYPEMSLRFLYGTDQDKKELKTLADKITKGITKDKDKLEAIIDWTNANLDYYIYASAYPMDTFHTRKGNCMSYSLFISQLLRLEGIPSVAVSGWVGDMKELTQKDLYEKLIFEGHAWIYVYVNNKWIMYDPLWYGTRALTDMQFVNENYYPGSIEGINVAPKGMDLDYVGDGSGPYYDQNSGKFMFHNEDGTPIGNSNNYVNNISLPVTMYDQEGCGYTYVDDEQAVKQMAIGEVFAGEKWIRYGNSVSYCFGNGVHPTGTVMKYNGVDMFMGDGGQTYKLLLSKDDYWIEGGYLAVKKGYKGYVMEPSFVTEFVGDPEYKISYKLDKDLSEKCVKVSEDGYVEAIDEGYAVIDYEVKRLEDGAYLSTGLMNLVVSSGREEPDYSSRKVDISNMVISLPEESFPYTGKAIKPAVTVVENYIVNGYTPTLTENRDYTVKYSNNKALGTATITVKGKGNYKGTLKTTFMIGPKGTTLNKLTGKSRSLKVSWKKMSKKTAGLRITGYEVAYSRYKDFREFVAYRVEGYKTTSETIKGLKAKKKYYVKVRTFIRKGSKIYYSPWSKAKSVKTK